MYDANQDPEKIREEMIKLTKQHRFALYIPSLKTSIMSTIPSEDRKEFRENDNMSHFICRIAYCRNEELRKWFLTQETRLFNARMQDVEANTI